MTNEYSINLLYPDLSYKIIGILFEAYNTLGYGHKEAVYQKTLAVLFDKYEIQYSQQVQVDLTVNDIIITKGRVDFLIDGKLILEIKTGNSFRLMNIKQLNGYLKSTNLKLGILANFTSRGLLFKRIVNIYDTNANAE